MTIRSKLIAGAASAGILFLGWQVGSADGATAGLPGTTDTTAKNTTTATTAGSSPATSATTGTTSGKATTGAATSGAATGGTATSPTSSATTGSAPTTGSTSTAGTGTTSGAAGTKSGTWTGTSVTHRYGSITVTVTLTNGKITDITYSSSGDRKNSRYEQVAVPQLKSAVLQAQSARVSTISGATLTSQAYLSSLQSALDKAAA